MNENGLKIFETTDLLYEAACNFIVDLSKKTIAERGRFVLSLSGGNTPEKLYSLLSQSLFRDQIDWKKIFIFWGDERCVPLNDKANNAWMAKSLLLDKIDIPEMNIYPVPVNLPPAEAATSYEKTLRDFFGMSAPSFDLVLLGLGTNGHTASLFPRTSVLHEQKRWVKEVYVKEQKMFRITMTTILLNQAYNVAFLVTGREKSEILKNVLSNSTILEYPAQLVKPETGKLFWFVDRDAAGNLAES